MIKSKMRLGFHLAGCASAALFLAALTGCTTEVDNPTASTATPASDTSFMVEGDYDYYPSYNVYYNRSSHQYAYMEGGYWVSRAVPAGVAINVLQASPAVRVAFRDSPANHNAEMMRKYPRDWRPPGAPKPVPAPKPEAHPDGDHS